MDAFLDSWPDAAFFSDHSAFLAAFEASAGRHAEVVDWVRECVFDSATLGLKFMGDLPVDSVVRCVEDVMAVAHRHMQDHKRAQRWSEAMAIMSAIRRFSACLIINDVPLLAARVMMITGAYPLNAMALAACHARDAITGLMVANTLSSFLYVREPDGDETKCDPYITEEQIARDVCCALRHARGEEHREVARYTLQYFRIKHRAFTQEIVDQAKAWAELGQMSDVFTACDGWWRTNDESRVFLRRGVELSRDRCGVLEMTRNTLPTRQERSLRLL